MFTAKDIEQITAKGLTPADVEQQIQHFTQGFPPAEIVRPATPGHGILQASDVQIKTINDNYEKIVADKKLLKFVPASGAATRMFKELYGFLDDPQCQSNPEEALLLPKYSAVKHFFEHIREFAFFNHLEETLKRSGTSVSTLLKEKKHTTLLTFFLTEDGLNYGHLPKGLLHFHLYGEYSRTAVEEHLLEGIAYAKNADNRVYIHFTVSPELMDLFKKHIAEVAPRYEQKYQVTFHISFSIQEPSTDTIAVNMDNTPFREKDGSLLFRPGGHGALLTNLNQLDADCIFIKNIDNVTVDRYRETTDQYKRVLAGLLFEYRDRIFSYLERLDGSTPDEQLLKEIIDFYNNELNTTFPEQIHSLDLPEKAKYLQEKLNRPIRLAGMVKSEGDTGGGPFITRNSDGSTSLQIVETAQIDLDNPTYREIFNQSTHFSPADFALCTKDYRGEKFDLMKYRDPATGFITVKSKDGKDLKAQELPGLWNGSMADWNSIFIEVPLITFNPVKSINDLLQKEHRSNG